MRVLGYVRQSDYMYRVANMYWYGNVRWADYMRNLPLM